MTGQGFHVDSLPQVRAWSTSETPSPVNQPRGIVLRIVACQSSRLACASRRDATQWAWWSCGSFLPRRTTYTNRRTLNTTASTHHWILPHRTYLACYAHLINQLAHLLTNAIVLVSQSFERRCVAQMSNATAGLLWMMMFHQEIVGFLYSNDSNDSDDEALMN